LPDDFCAAIAMVEQCAGRDESAFNLTCVHIHPRWVEGCDNTRLTRYRLDTGFETPILVRRDSIRHLTLLAPRRFSETDRWVHFRSPESGVVLSTRRFIDDYPRMRDLLAVEGDPLSLPRGLHEAAQRAADFAAENAEFKDITIRLSAGKMVVRGEGSYGWYSEPKKVQYSGRELTFSISPAVLSEVVNKQSDCIVSRDRLKIDGGAWQFVTCLGLTEQETRNGRKAQEQQEPEA
jgi:hypothetical protein